MPSWAMVSIWSLMSGEGGAVPDLRIRPSTRLIRLALRCSPIGGGAPCIGDGMEGSPGGGPPGGGPTPDVGAGDWPGGATPPLGAPTGGGPGGGGADSAPRGMGLKPFESEGGY